MLAEVIGDWTSHNRKVIVLKIDFERPMIMLIWLFGQGSVDIRDKSCLLFIFIDIRDV